MLAMENWYKSCNWFENSYFMNMFQRVGTMIEEVLEKQDLFASEMQLLHSYDKVIKLKL